jgi:predicted small integral membrane protein
VYSYALGVLGCHYHGNSAPVVAGTYATFSFDYLVTGATTYPITDYLASLEGVASGAIATANSLQNVWQRRSFTSAIISTSGNMNMYLYPGACGSTRLADSGTIYYRNPKVEITNVDTGNSTFNSTSNIGLWYDLSGNGYNGTLNGPTSNVSNKGNLLFNGSSQYVSVGSLITGNQSFSWGAWIYPTATGTPVFFGNVSIGLAMVSYWDSANNKVRVGTYGADRLTSGTAILPSTWGYTFWTWNGITLASYTNGIADGTATGFSFNISNLYTTIGNAVNAQYFNGRIAQTLVYNRTLTATEVSQNYEATKTRFGL